MKQPTPKSNGLLLHTIFDGGLQVSCLAFDPYDATRLLVGTLDGSLFLFNLAKNRVVLVSKLSQAISAVSFCGAKNEHVVCCVMQTLFLVQTEHCRVEKKNRSPHLNSVSQIAIHSLLPGFAISLSVDTLTVWDVNKLEARRNTRESLASRAAKVHFVEARITPRGIVTLEASGVLSLWTLHELSLIKRVALPQMSDSISSTFSALGSCARYSVVGSSAAAQVSILSPELEGISAVALPGSSGVVDVTVLDDDIIACHTADRHVWFVVVDKYAVSFSLSFPWNAPVVAFGSGGATYLAAATSKELHVYHLPTVKRHYDRTLSGAVTRGMNSGPSSKSSLLPFVKSSSDPTPDPPTESCESYEEQLPRNPIVVEEATSAEWVKANLVNNKDSAVGVKGQIPNKTLLLHEAVKQMRNEDRGNSSHGATNGSNSLSSAAGSRKQVLHNAAAKAGVSSTAAPGGSTIMSVSASGPTRAEGVAIRGFLDHESRSVNMDKLRTMLMRYGMFPEKYRTLIWRFLLQLPEKRFLAPQYLALTERGPHPGVPTLLEPFPLPKNKIRALLEASLSALAWQSSVLSVVHFVPNIVFPFVQLYGSDTQSVVEVCLSFLVNWGKEFFSFYPHRPVSIVSYLNHTLKHEDAELWNHLDECGVGVDVWGWDVMWPLYTEILTRNEWLQLMDHTFANEPIWLFLFHVRWVCQLREPLLQLHDHSQLVAMFRKATPVSMNTVIQQTYRLQQRCIHSALTEPYRTFVAFKDFAYPTILECDEAVITSKVRELERIEAHQNEVHASKARVEDVKKRIAQAAMLEDAFVGKQRAIVASKFDAANETWIQQVQLEKERQRLRDIEHETRLLAIQEQLRSAQRLEGLQHEINSAVQTTRDAQVDRDRETMKWDFSDRMSMQEIERLEMGAKLKLNTIVSTANLLSDSSAHNCLAGVQDSRDNVMGEPPIVLPPAYLEPASSAQLRSPPPPPAPQGGDGYGAKRNEVAAPVRCDSQTMTELPPLPPPSNRSDTSSSAVPRCPASAPHPHDSDEINENVCPQIPHEVGGPSASSSTDTSAPTSCEMDPIAYYKQLQESIRLGVESAQKEQKQRLAQLQSQFAQRLADKESASSEVTEPQVDDNTTTATSDEHSSEARGKSSNIPRQRTTREKGSAAKYVLEDNMEEVSSGRCRHDACSLLAGSSTASTSMTQVLLQPRSKQFFDLMHRDL